MLSSLRSKLWIGAALIGALLLLSVASASGEGEAESPSWPTTADLEAALEGEYKLEVPETNPLAADQLPHADLSRQEAEALLGAVFGEHLEAQADDLSEAEEISTFYSDHVGIMGLEAPNGQPGSGSDRVLVDSLLPLRTKSDEGVKEPVDLALEPSADGDLEPANPLVELKVPDELGEGIALPEAGVEVGLEGGAPERNPSILPEEVAFYPNVAPDTDLVVIPTPTGFETQTQIRSPQAPQTQTFTVTMPAGARLAATEEGGAEIVQDGRDLIRIPAPTAIDAEGRPVETRLTVQSSSLVVDVDTDGAAFPVLLDPVYESAWFWALNNHTLGLSEWNASTQSTRYTTPTRGNFGEPGLNIYSLAGPITPGAQAAWTYDVPRYASDFSQYERRPTSYIQNLTFSDVQWWIEEAKPFAEHPFLLMGIWDEGKGWWNRLATRNGIEGQLLDRSVKYSFDNVPQSNGEPSVNVKTGGIQMATFESTSRPRHLLVGQASVQLSDPDDPEVEQVQNPSKWVHDQPLQAVNFTALDRGLGVFGLIAKTAKISGGKNQWEQNVGCFGNVSVPCPRIWSGGFWNFDPKAMPQGEQSLEITARDPIGRISKPEGGYATVKVDHTAPELALAGTLTEQGSLGTKLAEYGLQYSAADGDEASAIAQTPIGTKGTGTGQLERPQGVAVDASGNVWVSDRINQRLVEYDKNGNFVRQIAVQGSGDGQIKEPRGIAVAPNGNIWVAEAGNKRVQQFTPNGVFVSKITSGSFIEPWGVAVGPDGTVWVTDQGAAGQVFLFKESGTLVKSINLGQGQLNLSGGAFGVDVDRYGNAYVAAQAANRVLIFSSAGSLVTMFGAEGTGPGQFKGPVDIAVTDSGNIAVSDDLNNRVQIFETDGSFLRQFGVVGSLSGQLKEPRAIDVGPGNQLLIADSGNARIARWSHADPDPQSGVAKLQVKVDGVAAVSKEPGCGSKNCGMTGTWTLDADDYVPGAHKVEVVATDGVGLQAAKTVDIETHGDRVAPTVALSGSMTEQANLGTTRPSYQLTVKATDAGSTAERKSGVVSTSISVDGKVIDATAPGCPAEGCSITRSWTLGSDTYSVGTHNVQVVAKDGAGLQTTKSLTITIERDTTAPSFSSLAALYNAPSGWVEQVPYLFSALVTDGNGYGVTAVQLKVDGTVVESQSGSCPAGGCGQFFAMGRTINMGTYAGGQHAAELVATDGAGNSRKRTWTINVVPKGEIPATEATDTLQAFEETTEATPIAPAEELLEPDQMELGDNPSLTETEGKMESSGVPDTTTINQKTAAITIEGPEDSITITPEFVGADPSSVIAEDLAGVLADVQANTDSIVRPQYNGAMQFSVIRDATSPETYSWRLKLDPDQYLVLADEDHAEVRYESGKTAYLFSAELAHDATGKAVETFFSVAGDVVTLHVNHRVAGVVYPVLAGQAYETAYETGTIDMPPTEKEIEEREAIEKGTIPPPPASGAFSQTEAAQLIASAPLGPEIISAPEATEAGSEIAMASSVSEKVVQPFKVCAKMSCGYWWAELKNPSYHYKRNASGRLTSYWQSGTEVHSEWWYPWYYWPELTAQGCGVGFAGQYQVWGGEQKHLTAWARYKITAVAFLFDGDYLDFDNKLGLQIWVWPNGYQQRVQTQWDVSFDCPEAV